MIYTKTSIFLCFLICGTSWIQAEEYKDQKTKVNGKKSKTGAVINWGSQTYQYGNSYDISHGQNIFGSIDVQSGNTFSGNPNGKNYYGPILVQENNTYSGSNENAVYGPIVIQNGNKYPEHPGNNDIYTGVVIQKNNTYSVTPGNKSLIGIIINQSNNTYPKSVEANKDALKPVINRSGNKYKHRKASRLCGARYN